MKLLDLTIETPAANLACDEALLDLCEAGLSGGVLRFWESPEYFVVLGYANKAGNELDLEACRRRSIPIFRRCSGGGAVLQGPGCLNYALVLPIDGALQSITQTNCHIMNRNRDALRPLVKGEVDVRGHTDLALDNLKFSGNSQRRRRKYLLFHGSFLLNFDLSLISDVLKFPSRQPDYRQSRSHGEFLTNLPLSATAVKFAMQQQWQVTAPLPMDPKNGIEALVEKRYSRHEWNLKW